MARHLPSSTGKLVDGSGFGLRGLKGEELFL